jgi:signal transduction histidine kinase
MHIPAMTVLSLRFRLLVGALLWTVGLFAATSALVVRAVLKHPHAARTFHDIFEQFWTVSFISAVCMLVGFWQVRRALSAMDDLRGRLADLHAGRERRLEGRYPAELEPLVRDLNTLLDQREQALRRAIAKSGDLAHGLKTPLAVLSHDAERAGSAGENDVAASIRQQVDRMRRQIDYHLALARAAASGAAPGARASLAESAEGLSRTLRRLHADRGVAIEVNVPADLAVRAQREDLDEMLGNLLDNACKWSRTRVVLTASRPSSQIVATVDDDGPGLEMSMRKAVLQRGVRADEAAPGTGLGLAIVRDLAELHGGTIVLRDSPLGGLRAELTLPAA